MPPGREDADGDGVDHLDQGPPSPSDARRLLLLTVLLLVGALVAVVALSRPVGSSAPEPSSPPPPRPSPSVRPTPSPTPSPRADVDEEQPVLDTSGVPVLPDADPSWELFLQTATDVQRLQLSTGDVVRTRSRVASAPGSRAAFLPGPDGVLAFSEESGTAEFVPDDAAAERVEVPGAQGGRGFATLLPGPPGQAWLSRFDYDRGSTTVELLDLSGRSAGGRRTITVPGTAWPAVLPDGVGGLLVQATGGVWSLAGDRPSRVTRGRVLATGPRALVLLDCDDALVCSRYVREQATGLERRLGPAEPSDGFTETGLTSPDGRWVATRGYGTDGTDRVVVVDLLDGRTVATLHDDGGSLSVDPTNALVWTPDGRQLLFLDGDGLRLLDPGTGEQRRVELGGVTPVRLALRP